MYGDTDKDVLVGWGGSVEEFGVMKGSVPVTLTHVCASHVTLWEGVLSVNIRHINPLMFDVIDDKLEGVARGVYQV